jgi:hypothetical protein
MLHLYATSIASAPMQERPFVLLCVHLSVRGTKGRMSTMPVPTTREGLWSQPDCREATAQSQDLLPISLQGGGHQHSHRRGDL